MNFKLSGHHLDITPPLREYVETKLERVIRHFDQVIGVSVLLSVDNHKEKNRRQYAEINLHLAALPHGSDNTGLNIRFNNS